MSNRSEEKKLKLEDASERNECVIPTLFRLKKSVNKDEKDYFTVKAEGFCGENVLKNVYKIGMTYNAVLPTFETSKEKEEYTYAEKANKENKIVFILPSEKKTKMLFMRLCDQPKEGDVSDDDTFVAICYKNEKYVKFNMPLKEKGYESLWISKEEPKRFCLYDEANGCSFLFECWTEYLPIPGENDGVFAYTDGSSRTYNKNDPKDGYGTGYVISKGLKNGEKEILFGHTESEEPKSNYEAEMEAVTNFLKNILEDIKGEKDLIAYQNLTIYFDNTQVGYYPGGLYKDGDWLKKNANPSAVEYRKAYEAYVGLFKEADMECNIEFIHVKAHFGAFGNEMADRLAQVNDKKLKDKKEFVEGYEDRRKDICPEGGQFSAPFTLLNP